MVRSLNGDWVWPDEEEKKLEDDKNLTNMLNNEIENNEKKEIYMPNQILKNVNEGKEENEIKEENEGIDTEDIAGEDDLYLPVNEDLDCIYFMKYINIMLVKSCFKIYNIIFRVR